MKRIALVLIFIAVVLASTSSFAEISKIKIFEALEKAEPLDVFDGEQSLIIPLSEYKNVNNVTVCVFYPETIDNMDSVSVALYTPNNSVTNPADAMIACADWNYNSALYNFLYVGINDNRLESYYSIFVPQNTTDEEFEYMITTVFNEIKELYSYLDENGYAFSEEVTGRYGLIN